MTDQAPARTIVLGNPHPIHVYPDGARPAEHLTVSTTVIELRPGFDDQEYVERSLSTPNDQTLVDISRVMPDEHRHHAVGIRDVVDLWSRHCAGGPPSWVDGDPEFAKALSVYYGCPIGQPEALLTNVGRDALHQQLLTTGSQPAAFHYMGISANATAPSATDTTLAGEITTGGGGLVRASATFAHTTGTNTSTLTNTFTANGSDTLPVTIAQIGIFNASSSGTICFHTALSGTATLSVIGDNITVTETVTAG